MAAIDARPCALARACLPLTTTMAGLAAILDIGWNTSTLLVLLDGVIVYQRTLSDGGVRCLAESAGKSLQMAPETVEQLLAAAGESADTNPLPEQIASPLRKHLDRVRSELDAPFAYTAREYAPARLGRLLLVGGGAGIPGVAEHLASLLQIDVTPVRPTDVVGACEHASGKSRLPAATAAVGLAQFGRGPKR